MTPIQYNATGGNHRLRRQLVGTTTPLCHPVNMLAHTSDISIRTACQRQQQKRSCSKTRQQNTSYDRNEGTRMEDHCATANCLHHVCCTTYTCAVLHTRVPHCIHVYCTTIYTHTLEATTSGNFSRPVVGPGLSSTGFIDQGL